MNIFWASSLFITSVGGLFLFFFFISFMLPRGTQLAKRIAQFIFKLWIPILACSGIYILLLVQEISAIRHSSQLYHDSKASANDDNLFYFASELFKNQRNFYIVILGIVILFSLLVISWQAHSWSARNAGLRSRLHQNQHRE